MFMGGASAESFALCNMPHLTREASRFDSTDHRAKLRNRSGLDVLERYGKQATAVSGTLIWRRPVFSEKVAVPFTRCPHAAVEAVKVGVTNGP